MPARKVLFITGTRADFGKLKPLIKVVSNLDGFKSQIFTTGMHMLQRYGSTWQEVAAFGHGQIHPYLNQNPGDSMDQVLGKTIAGLSDFVKEDRPDLIMVHGDRVEALAGAAVGTLNNILVGHIEGGELSGTVDEILRHSITKLSHVHFVANDEAKNRLIQMGEVEKHVHVIGSPDIDAMESPNLPNLRETLKHYGLTFQKYGILILHPVTTELTTLNSDIQTTMESLEQYGVPIVVIESNNDTGSDIIRSVYEKYKDSARFAFFPSMRFEYFLTLLKNASFMVGNSSAGVREAPHFGVPAINLGTRQNNRVNSRLVLNSDFNKNQIIKSLKDAESLERIPEKNFGDGKSSERFQRILESSMFWDTELQKQFIDSET